MRRLTEVLEAKELMKEAQECSTFKWLFEKPRVRKTADRANDALDRLERTVKARWSDETKAAYKALSARTHASGKKRKSENEHEAIAPHQWPEVQKMLEADISAEGARLDAEETFDQAEKQMSVSMARDGCKKAIHSWELREKAIRKAEALACPQPQHTENPTA